MVMPVKKNLASAFLGNFKTESAMNPDGVTHMITKRKAPRENIQEDEVSKRARLGAFDHHADGMESFVQDFSVKNRDFRSAESTDAPLLQSTSASVKGTFLRRLHDEDGVTVDLVLRNESLVVYKTYPTQDDMPCLIQLQDEVRLFHRMKGACHTIQLLETFCNEDGDFVLVFPYIEDVRPKGAQEIQTYMRQLMESLRFLHDDMQVAHRNIKRQNIMFDGARLTLIDMEDATHLRPGACYPRIGNGRYRAPEMWFEGDFVYAYNPFYNYMSPVRSYNHMVDMFSAGLVFGELLMNMHRFFPDWDTLEEDYEYLRDRLKNFEGDPVETFRPWIEPEDCAPCMTPAAADLLARMLCFDPAKRISAAEALQHPYFKQAANQELTKETQ